MNCEKYTEDISKYPVAGKMWEICECVRNSPTRFLILTAETGAGKSTVLPLGVMEVFGGRFTAECSPSGTPQSPTAEGEPTASHSPSGATCSPTAEGEPTASHSPSGATCSPTAEGEPTASHSPSGATCSPTAPGKILITEPRRLAVLGVASRVAELLGEEPGQSVGYKVHLDKRISGKTQLEVVTEAILVRQLQADPVLEGYNLVILDEFHERSVNTDLALAFLKEAMELRDDLFVIIMSATMDTDKIRHYLGDETPVFSVEGRLFPVDVIYDDKISVENAVLQELGRSRLDCGARKSGKNEKSGNPGNILVFLPGIGDIRRVERNLCDEFKADNSNYGDVELCVLHSSISLQEQRKILHESPNQRVILSSAIGETSLTVPGVTCVIDSGLARVNRMDIGAGMESLSTETESQFSAEQRKGRAGRLEAGRCIRLWSQGNARVKDMPCEILRADLSNLVLECAERGIFGADKINWLDKPSDASWNGSVFLLKQLGMIKDDGRITEKGQDALKLGVHPRIAAIALGDFNKGKSLLVKYGGYGKSSDDIKKRFLSDLERRVSGIGMSKYKDNDAYNSNCSLGMTALLGYPDRLGKRLTEKGEKPAVYRLPSGRDVVLGENGNHTEASEWIVAPDILVGARDTVVFDYEVLNSDDVEKWLDGRTDILEECAFENGKIKKTESVCYGKIVISSKKIQAGGDDLGNAWVNEVKNKGLECLPLSDKSKSLLVRGEFLWENSDFRDELQEVFEDNIAENSGKNAENVAENNFAEISAENNASTGEDNNFRKLIGANASQWIPAFLGTSKILTEEIVYNGLYWFIKGEKIDKKAPEMMILQNGNRAKVKYERLASPEDRNKLIIRPVIEIIIQRVFGCSVTPEICGVRVLLRLLSPASRPLQITDDLEGFWTGAWPEICKEMKGRYPKHNWNWQE